MEIKRLVQILQAEYEIYQQLYQLSEEKQAIIIDNRVDDLLSIIEDEQAEIEKINQLEEERVETLQEIADRYSLSDGELSFAKLTELISGPNVSELKNTRGKILDLLEDLRNINDTNANLIEESLKLNDYTLQLLTESNIGKTKTYQKPGKLNSSNQQNNQQQQRIIDQKA
ncbi:flagellar protein FlgN [Selenihalanaerobacter shriftii]|uniref:FlgN protein n=1 Tax=Selenihalanaerobacter shriftii TaxID=142842 RepID=A0A1T4KPH6_9FIRM|nr:flagellar protein FlgN [Selenihalanaerobacter shriftii]SJZ44301.1 FlgN protein [Selenihalanaerobacter shriftii]